jgi:hypothetical protein
MVFVDKSLLDCLNNSTAKFKLIFTDWQLFSWEMLNYDWLTL